MRVRYLVVGLSLESIVRDVYLSSSGVSTEQNLDLVRHMLFECDTEHEALNYINDNKEKFEMGFEIIKTYNNQ